MRPAPRPSVLLLASLAWSARVDEASGPATNAVTDSAGRGTAGGGRPG